MTKNTENNNEVENKVEVTTQDDDVITVIKLRKPITFTKKMHNDTTLNEVTLRSPLVKDVKTVDFAKAGKIEDGSKIIAAFTGIPAIEVSKLDFKDYLKIQTEINNFLELE